VTGETNIMVTPAVDEGHSEAALKVLSTPDALLTLVLGGDHLTDGIEAIQTAVENPVLRPHFAYVEARRLAKPFWDREADLEAASELIEDSTVMSPAEIEKAARLVEGESADSDAGQSIAETLKNKVRTVDVGDEVKGIVDSL
jgi:gamma-glutamyl phosphate reductase